LGVKKLPVELGKKVTRGRAKKIKLDMEIGKLYRAGRQWGEAHIMNGEKR